MLILLAQALIQERRGFVLHDGHHLTGEVAKERDAFLPFQFLQALINGIEAGCGQQVVRDGFDDEIVAHLRIAQRLHRSDGRAEQGGKVFDRADRGRRGRPGMPFVAFQGFYHILTHVERTIEVTQLPQVTDEAALSVGEILIGERGTFNGIAGIGTKLPHALAELLGTLAQAFVQFEELLAVHFAQCGQMLQRVLLSELRRKLEQRLVRAPGAFVLQQLLTGGHEHLGERGVTTGLLQQQVHGLGAVVLFLGGHAELMVQLQVAGKGHHHAAREGIDSADGHLRPVVQHVREHGLRTAVQFLGCDARFGHHAVAHVGLGAVHWFLRG